MNITLNIVECCHNHTNGFQRISEKSYTFNYLLQSSIALNCYCLSILSYTQNSITLAFENSNETHIRILHLTYPLEICFSSNNISHYIKISVSNLTS